MAGEFDMKSQSMRLINQLYFYSDKMLSFNFPNRFRERQMFVSSGTHMTLLVRRIMANTQGVETEFLDGAYSFFNGLPNAHIYITNYTIRTYFMY